MSSSSCCIGKFVLGPSSLIVLCSLLSRIFPLSHYEVTGANPFEYDVY